VGVDERRAVDRDLRVRLAVGRGARPRRGAIDEVVVVLRVLLTLVGQRVAAVGVDALLTREVRRRRRAGGRRDERREGDGGAGEGESSREERGEGLLHGALLQLTLTL